jgi:hypothetical protein
LQRRRMGIYLTKPRNGGERGRFLLAAATAAARLTNVLTVATLSLSQTVMRSWGCERVIR